MEWRTTTNNRITVGILEENNTKLPKLEKKKIQLNELFFFHVGYITAEKKKKRNFILNCDQNIELLRWKLLEF